MEMEREIYNSKSISHDFNTAAELRKEQSAWLLAGQSGISSSKLPLKPHKKLQSQLMFMYVSYLSAATSAFRPAPHCQSRPFKPPSSLPVMLQTS